MKFNGQQEDSIIFKGGITGHPDRPRKRKLIDDTLVIGALLTGWNWELYSFPLLARSNLESLYLQGKEKIEQTFQIAIKIMKESAWQIQFAKRCFFL